MADGLLNKASIILTPTGYKAGTLYNVAPVVEPYEDFDFARASVASRVNSSGLVEMVGRTLGSELVTNGDFATDSDWTLGAGWSIEDGKANVDTASNNRIEQDGIVSDGNTYAITFTILNYNSGSIRLRLGNTYGEYTSGNGTYTQYIQCTTNDKFRIYASSSGADLSIDNVSVKEVIDTNNIPRISYDSNGDNGHILLEPTSTNLVPYSENFEGGSWTNASVGTTPTLDGGYTAPDGSSTAYKISNPNKDSFWRYFGVADTNYAKTIWARTVSGTGTVSLLSKHDNSNNTFTLTEDWQRFEVNTTAIAEDYIYAVDFRGVGNTLDEVLVWGAQSENLPYATSYIPTLTGSTVTRATETANGAGSADLINSTEGVLYAEIAALANDGTLRMLNINDGTKNNRVGLQYSSTTNSITAAYDISGAGQVPTLSHTLSNALDFNKIAFKYKQNDFALWINGVEVGTDTSGNVLPSNTLNNIESQYGDGRFYFYGKCKALAVFKEALSDDELHNLTG